MADVQKTAKVVVQGEDKASAVFKQIGKSMGEMQGASGNLTGTLARLGTAGAALFAGWRITGFFQESLKAAADFQSEVAQLNAVLKSTGNAAGVTSDQALQLAEAMQRETAYTNDAVLGAENLLLTFTKIKSDIFPQATKTVLDMSTALNQDLKSSAIQLGKALQDPILGVQALRRVGVNFSESQQDVIKNLVETGKSAEAQALIMKELNTEFGGSAQAQLNTYAGRVAYLKNQFGDLQKNVGNILMPTMEAFFQGLIDGFNQSAEASDDLGVAIGERLLQRLSQAGLGLKKIFSLDFLGSLAALTRQDTKPLKEFFDDWKKQLDEIDAGIESDTAKKVGGKEKFRMPNIMPDTGETAKDAEKIKESFRDLAKSIVQSFQDQQKAVSDLRKTIKDLDLEMESALDKSNDKYQEDVKNLARQAKDRITDLDKQIADERSQMSAGWRDKIADLEAQKAKEQAIIDKANGVVTNLSSELSKDQFDILKESHDKELGEIRKNAQDKQKEAETEIAARTKFVEDTAAKLTTPGFLNTATKEGVTFLGSIGASASQQQIVFNFNNAVAGDEGIKKIISETIATLNRQATVRGVGGK